MPSSHPSLGSWLSFLFSLARTANGTNTGTPRELSVDCRAKIEFVWNSDCSNKRRNFYVTRAEKCPAGNVGSTQSPDPRSGDALINPPDLRQRSDISFFKVQGVNKRFMIGLLRRSTNYAAIDWAPGARPPPRKDLVVALPVTDLAGLVQAAVAAQTVARGALLAGGAPQIPRSNAHDVVEGTYADDPGPIGSLRKLLGGR